MTLMRLGDGRSRPTFIPYRVAVTIGAITALSWPARADRGDRWDAVTIAGQAGGGALGVAAGVLGGAAAGDLVGAVRGLGWGAALGGELGLVAGIQWAGDARGGTGRLWGTSIGALAGAVLASAVGAAREEWALGMSGPTIAALGATLILAGPIIGYHLSADDHAPTSSARSIVVPLVIAAF